MYELMTNTYYQSNNYYNRVNKEKIYKYSIYKDFQVVREGKCCNVSYRYHPSYDYNIVQFTDIDTGNVYSQCEFNINLKEITE